MVKMPNKCVIDTNVPLTANEATDTDGIINLDFLNCVINCVEVIENIKQQGGLILDAGDEIFTEYRHKLNLSGQPGVGDVL